LSLVNIVRENAGLAPVSDEELAKLVERVDVGPVPAKLIDLTGAMNSSSNASLNRILVAVCPHGGTTWFFKMAGDAGVVSAQRQAFVDFLKSVTFAESGGAGGHGAHFVSTNAKRIPSESTVEGGAADSAQGTPSWDVPAGWQPVPPSQMLLAKFMIGGAEGRAEVTVSAFPGDTGGVLANVNRWRGQVGLEPLAQTEVDRQVTALDVIGGKAMLVDVTGESKSAGKARLIGVIVPRERQTWFYKMMGDPVVAEREKSAFIKFVQSVRYPNV